MAAARDAGLDIGRLTKDIDSDEVKASLQEVMQIADALGLTGTPSYVVGSDVVVGAVGASDLQGRIDNLRRYGKTTCS